MKKPFTRALAVLLAILTLCAIGAVPVGAVSVSAETQPPTEASSLKDKLLTPLQWTWGLPQNLVGVLMYLLLDKYKVERFREAWVVYVKPFKIFGWDPGTGWVTLGKFIFVVSERYETAEEYLAYLKRNYYWHLWVYRWLLEDYRDCPNVTIGPPAAVPYAVAEEDETGVISVTIYPPVDPSSLSESEAADLFGKYNAYESDNSIIYHEYGHTLQSAALGPLFLPLIGVPSFLVSQGIVDYEGDYYDFYTEYWANLWAAAWLRRPVGNAGWG